MKCFTITEDNIISSIEVISNPFPHICVGNKGCKNKATCIPLDEKLASELSCLIPCPHRGKTMGIQLKCEECGIDTIADRSRGYYHPVDNGFINGYKPIERAFILRKGKSNYYIITEEREFDTQQALVLVDIPLGIDGINKWTCAEKEDYDCPNQGKKLEYSEVNCNNDIFVCNKCNEICEKVDEFHTLYYNHPSSGKVKKWKVFPPPGITIIAGGCPEENNIVRLLVMGPRTYFRIKRDGFIINGLEEYFIYWDGKNLYVDSEDKFSEEKKQLEIYEDDVF